MDFDLINEKFPANETDTEGSCDKSPENLNILFYKKEWTLSLEFKNETNSGDKTWELKSVKLLYSLETGKLPIPDIKDNITGECKHFYMHIWMNALILIVQIYLSLPLAPDI